MKPPRRPLTHAEILSAVLLVTVLAIVLFVVITLVDARRERLGPPPAGSAIHSGAAVVHSVVHSVSAVECRGAAWTDVEFDMMSRST